MWALKHIGPPFLKRTLHNEEKTIASVCHCLNVRSWHHHLVSMLVIGLRLLFACFFRSIRLGRNSWMFKHSKYINDKRTWCIVPKWSTINKIAIMFFRLMFLYKACSSYSFFFVLILVTCHTLWQMFIHRHWGVRVFSSNNFLGERRQWHSNFYSANQVFFLVTYCPK